MSQRRSALRTGLFVTVCLWVQAAPVAALADDTRGTPAAAASLADREERAGRADGARTKSLFVKLAAGERRVITIGALEREAHVAMPPVPVVTMASATRPTPTLGRTVRPESSAIGQGSSLLPPVGWALAALGVASIAVGATTGYFAHRAAETVGRECDDVLRCSPAGVDAARDGASLATVSTTTLISGAVALAVGLTLVLAGSSGRLP